MKEVFFVSDIASVRIFVWLRHCNDTRTLEYSYTKKALPLF